MTFRDRRLVQLKSRLEWLRKRRKKEMETLDKLDKNLKDIERRIKFVESCP